MTNEQSLLPCPFCGSTDLGLQRKADPSPPSYPDGVCVIECFGCGALGPFCEEDQNAAKAWNDRGRPIHTCETRSYCDACDADARGTAEPKADVPLWMCRGKYEGIWVYFRPGETRMEVYDIIMEKARKEGFRGTIQERLKELGWEVVPMKAYLDLAENR